MNHLHDIHLPFSAFVRSVFHLIPYSLILIPLFALPAFSQQRWERTYGGTQEDRGNSVQQTSDGGYIIAGHTKSFGSTFGDVYLIKTNASGDTLWTKTYGGADADYGFSVQQTSDGGYIISGLTGSFGAGNWDVYLIKTNISGDTLWTRTYGGRDADYGCSSQQTSDGGYIIAGFTYSFGPGTPTYPNFYLIKTNASGDTLWTRTYGGTNRDEGRTVQQTSDTGFIVVGWTQSFGAGNWDVYLIKTNPSGDTLWTKTYGGTSNDWGSTVCQTLDGGYIIAGYTDSFGAGGGDVFLIKTNASGDTIWTKTYGGTNWDEGNSVLQTLDSGYVIAGYTNSFGAGGFDAYLIKTNASGDTLWTRTYGGTSYDFGNVVRQTADGGYIIVGSTGSFGAGGYDVYLIKTDENGNVGIETERGQGFKGSRVQGSKIKPNPFISFAKVPGHEAERFSLYDISGRKVGTYKGDRIGEGLGAGVYFLAPEGGKVKPLRIVKVK